MSEGASYRAVKVDHRPLSLSLPLSLTALVSESRANAPIIQHAFAWSNEEGRDAEPRSQNTSRSGPRGSGQVPEKRGLGCVWGARPAPSSRQILDRLSRGRTSRLRRGCQCAQRLRLNSSQAPSGHPYRTEVRKYGSTEVRKYGSTYFRMYVCTVGVPRTPYCRKEGWIARLPLLRIT